MIWLAAGMVLAVAAWEYFHWPQHSDLPQIVRSTDRSRDQTHPVAPIVPRPTDLPHEKQFSESEPPQNTQPHHVSVQILEDYTVVAQGDLDMGILPDEYRDRIPERAELRVFEVQTWPNEKHKAGLTISYVFSETLRQTAPQQVAAVRRAAEIFKNTTPVRFEELKTDQYAAPTPQTPANGIIFDVLPESQSGLCLSRLGHQGGWQPIRLGRECGTTEILHELLHALGFIHEHSRPERDAWVKVDWSVIRPEHRMQFEVVPQEWFKIYERLGPAAEFDPTSIMMYRLDSFSNPVFQNRPTMKWIHHTPYLPPSDTLSASDRARLNALYSR